MTPSTTTATSEKPRQIALAFSSLAACLLPVLLAETSHPRNRLAGQKTASRFFCESATFSHLETPLQVTETHQENVTYIYVFASGCAVAPNSGGLFNGPVSLHRGEVGSGEMFVYTGNLDAKNKAAAQTNANNTLALLMKSETFSTAYNTMINQKRGLVINPVDYSGAGTINGNNLIFGTLAGVRADGSIVYPAYVIAHELAHMYNSFDEVHKDWDLVANAQTAPIMAAVRAPNVAEYYAYRFAEQVSKEVFDSTGVNIGRQSTYYDVGTTSKDLGWIPGKK